jgi:microcystin-dependent protein
VNTTHKFHVCTLLICLFIFSWGGVYSQTQGYLTNRGSIEQVLPPGVIIAFGGTTAPAGWILCDGSPVSRTTYSGLYSAIGNNYGSGDGSTTFNLPDLRGRFLRGADNGAGNDPDATGRVALNSGGASGDTVGSVQGDQFASHNHTGTTTGGVILPPPTQQNTGTAVSAYSNPPYISFQWGGNPLSYDRSLAIDNSGGNETRPKNVSVNYIIKY